MQKATVLVVDDSSAMRMMLKSILKRLGYEVVGEAGDGKAAVAKFTELKPQVVTLDLTMPVMNGLEAMDEIFKHDPNARVVVISAELQDNSLGIARDKGARDFIEKPFEHERVKNAMEKALA